eukprot:PhM_4_TR19104/c2_g1_i1/m.28040
MTDRHSFDDSSDFDEDPVAVAQSLGLDVPNHAAPTSRVTGTMRGPADDDDDDDDTTDTDSDDGLDLPGMVGDTTVPRPQTARQSAPRVPVHAAAHDDEFDVDSNDNDGQVDMGRVAPDDTSSSSSSSDDDGPTMAQTQSAPTTTVPQTTAPVQPLNAAHLRGDVGSYDDDDEEDEDDDEGGMATRIDSRNPLVAVCLLGPDEEGHSLAVKTFSMPPSERTAEELQAAFTIIANNAAKKQEELKSSAVPFVPLYDLQLDAELPSDQLRLILPYSQGGTVADAICAQPIDVVRARAIVYETLTALDALHEGDYVHGNLKSTNVHLVEDGSVVLSDFNGVTAGPVALTQNYAHWSPEMCDEFVRNFGDVTDAGDLLCEMLQDPIVPRKPSDVWALGMLALELICGFPACHGKSPRGVLDWVGVDGKDVQRFVQDLGDARGASREIVSFILSCLEADPRQRAVTTQLLQHPWMAQINPAVNPTPPIIKMLALHTAYSLALQQQEAPGFGLEGNRSLLRHAVYGYRDGAMDDVADVSSGEDLFLTGSVTLSQQARGKRNALRDVVCEKLEPESAVIIMDTMRAIRLCDSTQSVFLFGPCDVAVIENMRGCQITVAARHIILRNCHDCTFVFHANTIHGTDDKDTAGNNTFSPYYFALPGLSAMWLSRHLCNPARNAVLPLVTDRMPAEIRLQQGRDTMRVCDYPLCLVGSTLSSSELHIRDRRNVFVQHIENETSVPMVNFMSVCLERVEASEIWVLGVVSHVRITNCQDTIIVLGPSIEGAVIEDCENCTIHIPSFGPLTLVNCGRCVLRAWVREPIVLSGCTGIEVGPYVMAYSEVDLQLECIGVTEDTLPENVYGDVTTLEQRMVRGQAAPFKIMSPLELTGLAIALPNLDEPSPILLPGDIGNNFEEHLRCVNARTLLFTTDNMEITRWPGTLEGVEVQIENVTVGRYFIFDVTPELTVQDCIATKLDIVVNAARKVVVRRCENLTLHVCCAELLVVDCHNIVLHVHTNTVPVIECSTDVTLQPFAWRAPELANCLASAGVTNASALADLEPDVDNRVLAVVAPTEPRDLPMEPEIIERLNALGIMSDPPNVTVTANTDLTIGVLLEDTQHRLEAMKSSATATIKPQKVASPAKEMPKQHGNINDDFDASSSDSEFDTPAKTEETTVV